MRKILRPAKGILFFLFSVSGIVSANAASPPGSGFSAQRLVIEGIPVVRLIDADREIEVSILVSQGNRAYEMKVRGENILYLPDTGGTDFLKRTGQNGIPFMAPWANRLDSAGFWFNGRRYNLNPDLQNYRKDGNGLPLHGLIMNSALWELSDIGADGNSAYATCRLEFWKHPDLMAQWPFAHGYEMTYRLANGSLEVQTTVSNPGAEAMPLLIGFHPYFSIPGVPRDSWSLHLPARREVVMDDRLIPTGEFADLDLPNPLPLERRALDNGFTDMELGTDGRATFSIAAGERRVDVVFGPKYTVAQVWLPTPPPGQSWNFICIEPMTGVTNGINLNHDGRYPGLQTVPAGGTWTESFWIRPEGF